MAATTHPAEAAEAAGLVYITDDEPGFRRTRCGRGFRYLDSDGAPLSDAQRERCKALVIPPAWTDVWISPDPDGHIQATGRDQAGRKQYRYHDEWRSSRDAEKFANLLSFGSLLTDLRAQVAADLDRRSQPRRRVLALVVRLLDETLIRVGNPEYAERESFGLTTLEPRHVDIEAGTVTFDFTGKHLIEHQIEVRDRSLARMIRACDEVGGDRLFCYSDGESIAEISSDDVNAYLRELAGPEVTARDFRTWGGTATVIEELGGALGRGRPLDRSTFLAAVDVAAERLGNTRTVCRNAYVHPAVERAVEEDALGPVWRGSRRTARMSRAERATLRLLAEAPA